MENEEKAGFGLGLISFIFEILGIVLGFDYFIVCSIIGVLFAIASFKQHERLLCFRIFTFVLFTIQVIIYYFGINVIVIWR